MGSALPCLPPNLSSSYKESSIGSSRIRYLSCYHSEVHITRRARLDGIDSKNCIEGKLVPKCERGNGRCDRASTEREKFSLLYSLDPDMPQSLSWGNTGFFSFSESLLGLLFFVLLFFPEELSS